MLCGTSFSNSSASPPVGSRDADLRAWRERRLTMAYPYPIIHARCEHVRANGQIVSQGLLIVKGVRGNGMRERLAVEVADAENAAMYEGLFRRLKDGDPTGMHAVACFAFPEVHLRPILATSGLERFNLELKRRTRVVRILPNTAGCLRLGSSVCIEQSAEWLARRMYANMHKLDAAADERMPHAASANEAVKNTPA